MSQNFLGFHWYVPEYWNPCLTMSSSTSCGPRLKRGRNVSTLPQHFARNKFTYYCSHYPFLIHAHISKQALNKITDYLSFSMYAFTETFKPSDSEAKFQSMVLQENGGWNDWLFLKVKNSSQFEIWPTVSKSLSSQPITTSCTISIWPIQSGH